MDKKNFAFSKQNYIICAVSVALIIIGFVLMTGPATTVEGGFEPDIFSTKRIVVATMVCFSGFLLMIVGILFPSQKKKVEETTERTN